MADTSTSAMYVNVHGQEYTVIVSQCAETLFFDGHVPDMDGAYTYGETRDELKSNMKEVIEMLLEEAAEDAQENYGMIVANVSLNGHGINGHARKSTQVHETPSTNTQLSSLS